MTKKALITGITGQDGSYLAELLLDKGYEVYGLIRRTSSQNFSRVSHLVDRLHLVPGDLMDQHSLTAAVYDIQPDEVYNHVVVDDKLFRPAEVNKLVADSGKACSVLGWQPKVTFEELIATMVRADLAQESSRRSEGLQGVSINEIP